MATETINGLALYFFSGQMSLRTVTTMAAAMTSRSHDLFQPDINKRNKTLNNLKIQQNIHKKHTTRDLSVKRNIHIVAREMETEEDLSPYPRQV